MILLFICAVLCRVVEFTILYEKNQGFEIQKVSHHVISRIVDDYNTVLAPLDLKLRLGALLPYNEYVSIPDYGTFSKFAGSGNVLERAVALRYIDTNLLILFSSVERRVESKNANKQSLCRGRFFMNLRSLEPNDDIYTAPIKVIKGWLEYILQTNLPEIYDMMKFNLDASVDFDRIKRLQTAVCKKLESKTSPRSHGATKDRKIPRDLSRKAPTFKGLSDTYHKGRVDTRKREVSSDDIDMMLE